MKAITEKSAYSAEVIEILEEYGAIQKGHFILTSGKHSDGYVNLRTLAGNGQAISTLAILINEALEYNDIYLDWTEDIESLVIVGPETMGRSLVENLAAYNSNDETGIDYAWCRPNANGTAMEWDPKLNFADKIAGRDIYIVDDVLTTAKTINQVKALVEASGGKVVGVVVVVCRDPQITAEALGVEWMEALLTVDIATYDEGACPLCQEKVPVNLRPGHGHEWIEEHPGYPVIK